MKAGKIATLTLVLILTAVAGAVFFVADGVWFQRMHPMGRWLAVCGLLAIGFSLVLVPLGIALDRTIVALQQSMLALSAQPQDAASMPQGQDHACSPKQRQDAVGVIAGPDAGGGLYAARWLGPLTRSCLGAAEMFRRREKELRGHLRDQEIRQRVGEAELGQLKAVLHSLRDAVLVTDPFDEIIFLNRAAADILGPDAGGGVQPLDIEQSVRQPIDRIVRDQRLCRMIIDAREAANAQPQAKLQAQLQDAASSRWPLRASMPLGVATHIEHELHPARIANGEAQPQDMASMPLRASRLYDVTLACVENHKRQVGAVVTILHDLTRERELSQMKSDFVSKASHELRTPLSSIRAYVEMLVDGEAADEAARDEFYKVIQNETERLGRMIDNMLNISRIEAGIVQIDRVSVDMKKLIARAVESLEPQAGERRISLHARPVEVDLGVEGDADMLYQVVLNLVSNAVKYTPEGGRVTISADSDNLTRSVVVTVADTGLGIPPDAMPRLFDKFYRVEHMKRMAKGTGLGLNLCKHIVETVHHGQIGVESTLGMGSKFWFSIPMRYAGSQAAA